MCFLSYLLCISNTNFNMINRFITLCSVYIIVMIAMINVCNARSNYNNVEPQMIGSPHSKAMKQENLEDAIKIFLQEWELHHHKSEPTHSGSVSHLYQNDHPNLMSNHINSSFPLIPPNVSSSNPLMFTSNQNITDEIRTYMQSMHHINDSIPFSSAINCTRCVMHEEARSRRLETIKADILNKLGLKTAPNITSKTLPRIPHLQHLFPGYHAGMQSDSPLLFDDIYDQTHSFIHQTNQENDFEEFYVNAQRSISFAEPPPKSFHIPEELKCQYFKFSPNVLNSQLTKAHLWVYLSPTNQMQETTAWINIYQVVKQENGFDSPTLLHVRSKKVEVNPGKGTWASIELKKLVSQWFKHPNENLGLVIQTYDNEGRKDFAVVEPLNGDQSLRPFIETEVESKLHSRKRRMIGLNCEENSNEVRCCRYPLTVDFEEFGWDWIIAPKRYEANYCSGECPYVFLQKYPHTHLVQQANPSGSAGPCCAPRRMSAISMLYFDDNYNIIYGMLPGMVVDRCGCS